VDQSGARRDPISVREDGRFVELAWQLAPPDQVDHGPDPSPDRRCIDHGPHVTCRIILVVLTFTSLRAPPAGVYEATPWTSFLPHSG
jgi:hypothetical protein